MNVNANVILFSTIAAERRQAFTAEAELRGLRRLARIEAKNAKRAAFTAPTNIRSAQRPAPNSRAQISPARSDTVLASSDLEHASARVA